MFSRSSKKSANLAEFFLIYILLKFNSIYAMITVSKVIRNEFKMQGKTSKQSDKVSVIIPMYNAEKYIKQAIDSVRKQSYDNIEIICIDDASTDNSLKIAKKELNEQDKLILLPKNNGVAKARNIGIKNATGRYIAFLDVDDFWAKEKLEKQIHFMQENKISFCYTGFYYLKKQKTKEVHVPAKQNYKQALKNTIILTSTVMIDTKNINKNELYMPNIKSEDMATWWKLLKKHEFAYGINKALTYHRVGIKSLSSNKFKNLKHTWQLYRKQENLKFIPSIYYFNHYILNAIRKRIN